MAAKQLLLDPDTPDVDVLGVAARTLAAGDLVGYPTDTLYGLAADPRQPAAVARLFHVKRRQTGMAIPLVAADLAQAETGAGILTPVGRRLAQRFWPGALALVVDASAALDHRLLGEGQTVAVRVPANAVARALARLFDYPITATSANRSGGAAAITAAEVVDIFGATVDVVLDAGPTPGGSPSTIVDVRGDVPRLVREGVVPWDRVLQSLA